MIEMDMPKLEVLENDDFYAKVVCEPLEKGFGLTIGNCLRRILLSALPGAAVEGIKFLDGSVKHEFSAVKGIKEDVTEIILNLKTLALRTKVTDKAYEKVLHITKEGPAVLTGADLNVDAEVEVINKDQYICTIDEGGKFDVAYRGQRQRLSPREGKQAARCGLYCDRFHLYSRTESELHRRAYARRSGGGLR